MDATRVIAQYQAVFHTRSADRPEVVALRAVDARLATASLAARPTHRRALTYEWWCETYAIMSRFVEVCGLSDDESDALFSECYRLRKVTEFNADADT